MASPATDWLVPPQNYNPKSSNLAIGRGYIRYALRNHQILVFRLLKDSTTSTGFKLNYRLASNEPYMAISHSWTDRTGRGDAIEIGDLAPWVITVSPAKIGLLQWLFEIQSQGNGEPWTRWYWMDLFCIDQSRDDEGLFAQQLEQIPSVFFRARSCLALLASRPCWEAMLYWKNGEFGGSTSIETREDEHWESVVKWAYEHSKKCACSPTLDSWLTRVWKRQEVLYSKDLTMVPATIWLGGSSSSDMHSHSHVWENTPETYVVPLDDGGIREFASMLVTWEAKYHGSQQGMSSSRIAEAARLLLCGEKARFSQPAEILEGTGQYYEPSLAWHAFNWTMIVDGSIRYTTHTRDAILSQMLLLPGYRVPPEPWSMPLEELIADSCIQYRQQLRRWQIVPMVTEVKSLHDGDGKLLLLPKLSCSFENASLCEILLAVGSPCILPACFYDLIPPEESNPATRQSSLMVYQIPDEARYKVISSLDLESRPHEAADTVLSLQNLWSDAEDCRTAWNIRACLDDIKTRRKESESDELGNTQPVKDALRHFIGRLMHTYPFTLSEINRRSDTEVQYNSDELSKIEVPTIFALEVTHQAGAAGILLPKYTTLACGDLLIGEEGSIWGLGQDKTTKLEFGAIIGNVDRQVEDGTLGIRIRASGILMMGRGRSVGEMLATVTDYRFGHVLP